MDAKNLLTSDYVCVLKILFNLSFNKTISVYDFNKTISVYDFNKTISVYDLFLICSFFY